VVLNGNVDQMWTKRSESGSWPTALPVKRDIDADALIKGVGRDTETSESAPLLKAVHCDSTSVSRLFVLDASRAVSHQVIALLPNQRKRRVRGERAAAGD
jgi:hypothetical protein